MITHDLVIMGLEVIKKNSTNKVDIAIINDAIELIKRGGEVERDVKRYFELEERLKYIDENSNTPFEIENMKQTHRETLKELQTLEDKLKKVGNEDV